MKEILKEGGAMAFIFMLGIAGIGAGFGIAWFAISAGIWAVKVVFG